MKYSKKVSKSMVQDECEHKGCWKTHPRMAYIPGLVLTSLFLTMFLFIRPAFSFEVVQDHAHLTNAQGFSTALNASKSCASMLSVSTRQDASSSPRTSLVRDQHLAGSVAAFGLVAGVRFALSPAGRIGSKISPSLGIWQANGDGVDDRSALAITAYRQCQKEQALKALYQ